jgi:hypothetical protein
MDWFEVKQSNTISLLQASHAAGGTAYRIVKNHASSFEIILYPTASMKASDGSATVERDAPTAYARFNELIASTVGISTTGAGIPPGLGQSFEDFDERLLALEAFPSDLTRELQRRGRNAYGGEKATLNLMYPSNFHAMFSRDIPHDRMARLRYASYPLHMRLQALRDLHESMLATYMDGTIVSQIIAANRELRKAYVESDYDGSMDDFADNQTTHLIPDTPVASFEVQFIDQNGEEIRNLPYKVAVRGAVNFRQAWLRTTGGKNPGGFASGMMLMEDSDRATSGEHLLSHQPDRNYHTLYPYKTDGSDAPLRGTVRIAVIVPPPTRNSPWLDDRLKAYGGTPATAADRERNIVPASSGVVLLSQSFRIESGRMAFTVRVPIHREPLPTHLIEGPSGPISLWSTIPKVQDLPDHQKVTLTLNAKVWTQAEAYSASGVPIETGDGIWATAPRGTAITFAGSRQLNTWISSRNDFTITTGNEGIASIDLPPGRYAVSYGTVVDHIPAQMDLGTIEVPAAFYYRTPDSNDTTPLAIVGAKILSSQDSEHYDNFHLNQLVPSLAQHIRTTTGAQAGSIYRLLSQSHPSLSEQGWPTIEGTATDGRIFDTVDINLQPSDAMDAMDDIETAAGQAIMMNEKQAIEVLHPWTNEPTGKTVFVERVRFDNSKRPILQIEWNDQGSPYLGHDGSADIDLHRIRYQTNDGIEAIVWYPENMTLTPVPQTGLANVTGEIETGMPAPVPISKLVIMHASPEASMLMGMRIIIDAENSVNSAFELAVEHAQAGGTSLTLADSGYRQHFPSAWIPGLRSGRLLETTWPGVFGYHDSSDGMGGTQFGTLAGIQIETGDTPDLLYAPPVIPEGKDAQGFLEMGE